MAPDDIRGSGAWTEQILEAIERANALVVVISSKSTSSAHVGREVNLALDQGKPVIPVRIEDVAVSGTLHYLWALVQWVDAFPLPLRRHQEKLRSRIVDVLSDLETTVPETPPKSEVRSHVALWTAAVGLVLVTSAVAVNWIGGNRSPADETTSTSELSPPSITT